MIKSFEEFCKINESIDRVIQEFEKEGMIRMGGKYSDYFIKPILSDMLGLLIDVYDINDPKEQCGEIFLHTFDSDDIPTAVAGRYHIDERDIDVHYIEVDDGFIEELNKSLNAIPKDKWEEIKVVSDSFDDEFEEEEDIWRPRKERIGEDEDDGDGYFETGRQRRRTLYQLKRDEGYYD